MKITTITYHRKKNLGNYETEDISLTAEIDEEDNYQDAIEALKRDARDALGIEAPKPKPNFDDKPF